MTCTLQTATRCHASVLLSNCKQYTKAKVQVIGVANDVTCISGAKYPACVIASLYTQHIDALR
jgi:hypothetical protein